MKKIFILLFLTFSYSFSQIQIMETKFEPHQLLKNRIETWIQSLEQKNSSFAIKNLVKIGKIAYPQLQQHFPVATTTTKEAILEILAQLKIEESVPLLIECLKNQKETVALRERAIEIIQNFPSKEVYQQLAECAFQRNIHLKASYALCRMDSKDAVPYLIELLRHWDSEIIHRAYDMLLHITEKKNMKMDYELWKLSEY
ncbi:MAG: HEAT repeat domain-containing protein [Planctomycetes bacterium]|jgi:HEAT repeat protein|nr:HEAT repeat domain-containing protein [Planctomycetota bacterium]HNZ66950.1 HEAT repeat domain-containing protein [Planctomycetota bacterium]HPY74987.1 HEAT repeat domain-containing protein [Planctomycetota bacterium]HQB01346.1 HEAT repeat domain-containing protein [Planctomycetota bacterium]